MSTLTEVKKYLFTAKCKKDLLLIVDTSFSIGKFNFGIMKKFLKKFVTDSRLNVGQDGTQVGLILFSSKEKTLVKLRMGQIQDAQRLGNYMNSLHWHDVRGGHTRTELALKLAKQVSLICLSMTGARERSGCSGLELP